MAKQCGRCGTVYQDRLQACPTCGLSQQVTPIYYEEEEPYYRRSRGWYIAFLIRTGLSALVNLITSSSFDLEYEYYYSVSREEFESACELMSTGSILIALAFAAVFIMLLCRAKFAPHVLVAVEVLTSVAVLVLGSMCSSVFEVSYVSVGMSVFWIIMAVTKLLK